MVRVAEATMPLHVPGEVEATRAVPSVAGQTAELPMTFSPPQLRTAPPTISRNAGRTQEASHASV